MRPFSPVRCPMRPHMLTSRGWLRGTPIWPLCGRARLEAPALSRRALNAFAPPRRACGRAAIVLSACHPHGSSQTTIIRASPSGPSLTRIAPTKTCPASSPPPYTSRPRRVLLVCTAKRRRLRRTAATPSATQRAAVLAGRPPRSPCPITPLPGLPLPLRIPLGAGGKERTGPRTEAAARL